MFFHTNPTVTAQGSSIWLDFWFEWVKEVFAFHWDLTKCSQVPVMTGTPPELPVSSTTGPHHERYPVLPVSSTTGPHHERYPMLPVSSTTGPHCERYTPSVACQLHYRSPPWEVPNAACQLHYRSPPWEVHPKCCLLAPLTSWPVKYTLLHFMLASTPTSVVLLVKALHCDLRIVMGTALILPCTVPDTRPTLPTLKTLDQPYLHSRH